MRFCHEDWRQIFLGGTVRGPMRVESMGKGKGQRAKPRWNFRRDLSFHFSLMEATHSLAGRQDTSHELGAVWVGLGWVGAKGTLHLGILCL